MKNLLRFMLIALVILQGYALSFTAAQWDTDVCVLSGEEYTNFISTKLSYQQAMWSDDLELAQTHLDAMQAIVVQACPWATVHVESAEFAEIEPSCNTMVQWLFGQHRTHINAGNEENATRIAEMIDSIITAGSCSAIQLAQTTAPNVLQWDIIDQQTYNLDEMVIPRNRNICFASDGPNKIVTHIRNTASQNENIQEIPPLQEADFMQFNWWGDGSDQSAWSNNVLRTFVNNVLSALNLPLRQNPSYQNNVLPVQAENIVGFLDDFLDGEWFDLLYGRFGMSTGDVENYRQALFSGVNRDEYMGIEPEHQDAIQTIRDAVMQWPVDQYTTYTNTLWLSSQRLSAKERNHIWLDFKGSEFAVTPMTNEQQADPIVITLPTQEGTLELRVVHLEWDLYTYWPEDISYVWQNDSDFVISSLVLNLLLDGEQIAAIDFVGNTQWSNYTQDITVYSKPYIIQSTIKYTAIEYGYFDRSINMSFFGPWACGLQISFEPRVEYDLGLSLVSPAFSYWNLFVNIWTEDKERGRMDTILSGSIQNYNVVVQDILTYRETNANALLGPDTADYTTIELFYNDIVRAVLNPIVDINEGVSLWQVAFVPWSQRQDLFGDILDSLIADYALDTTRLQWSRNTLRNLFGWEDTWGDEEEEQRLWCTDPEATNYDSKAQKDDGSCTYDNECPRWSILCDGECIPEDRLCEEDSTPAWVCTIDVDQQIGAEQTTGTTSTMFDFLLSPSWSYNGSGSRSGWLEYGDGATHSFSSAQVGLWIDSHRYSATGTYTVTWQVWLTTGAITSLVEQCTVDINIVNWSQEPQGNDPEVCDNGATNHPTCDRCGPGHNMVNEQCVPEVQPEVCDNGATNYSECDICEEWYELVDNQCVEETADPEVCENWAINYPDCNFWG